MAKFFLIFSFIFFIISCATKQGDGRILNQMIVGKTHFDKQEYFAAKNIFLEISNQINAVWNRPEEAKKVRQLWYEESVKTFKGEPYERVMLFFYLGVLFLLGEDYGNAQASFGQAILQDSFAQEQQHRSDFAIAYFLQSLSQNYSKAEQLAEQNFEKFQELKPDFVTADFEFGNTTLIVETGQAPQKIATGKYNEYLSYQAGVDNVHLIRVTITEKKLFLYALGDIYWQASSRGGRPIDKIAKGKVIFKDTSKIAGEILFRTGVEISRFGGDDNTALAFAAIGLGASILAETVKTKADTRQWSNLPNKIYLKNLQFSPGFYDIVIESLNDSGAILESTLQTIEIKKDISNIFYWRM